MIRVSVLELPARWNARADALAETDELLARAPTDLAILPEMALEGYVSAEGDFDRASCAETIDGATVHEVLALAKTHRAYLVAPLVLAEGGRIYNALFVASPDGSVAAVYRKRRPWFPETWATPGEAPPPVIEIGGVVITTAICFDAHFVADDARDALAAADLLVFTSAWVDEEDSRIPLLRNIARRFGTAVANANWSAGIVSVPGQGGSCILGAGGEMLASVAPGDGRADASIDRLAAAWDR